MGSWASHFFSLGLSPFVDQIKGVEKNHQRSLLTKEVHNLGRTGCHVKQMRRFRCSPNTQGPEKLEHVSFNLMLAGKQNVGLLWRGAGKERTERRSVC